MTLTIASWNVESIRAHLDQVIGWLQRHEPDVLCMQETKVDRRRFPISAFDDAGYELVVHGGGGGRGGVAIASRLELGEPTLGIPGAVAPLDDPRSISVAVGGVHLHTIYAPNGRKVGTDAHEVKLAWFALLHAWLEAERGDVDDQLLIGDFNIAPADNDVWEASRYRKRNLTSPRERAAFAALLANGELVDVVRQALGDDPVFTWWNRRSDFYETDRGWRLDHALASPALAARVTGVSIDRAERGRPGSSDHAPLTVTFDRTTEMGV